MLVTCKACGNKFEGTASSSYCSGLHYKKCEYCNKLFVWNPRSKKRCCSRKCAAELRRKTIHQEVRICELCGKEFHPNNNSQRYCNDDHFYPCPICSKPVKVATPYDMTHCCSKECSNKMREQTSIEIYGVRVVSQAPEVRSKLHDAAVLTADKRAQTCLENWGVHNPAMHPTVKTKISITVNSEECKEQTKVTNRARYGADHAMKTDVGKSRYIDSIQNKYDVKYYCLTDEFKKSQGNVISKINRQFGALLRANGIRYKHEKPIEGFSYDIWIAYTNILIEIDPTYTHNTLGNHWGPGLDKYYHAIKSQVAEKHNYRCIHVFDWMDWNYVLYLIMNYDRLQFSEFHEPKLFFSKDKKVLEIRDPEDTEKLLSSGWSPIYDAGQDIVILDE